MNNNFFSVVRYLRDRGIDATLLLLETELDHFSPSDDTFDSAFERYTQPLSWGTPFDFPRTPAERIAADLEPFNRFFVCGSAPAFLEKAGLRADVFAPYGTDFMFYPFFQIVHPLRQAAYLRFSRAQRLGIRHARYVNLDLTNDVTERRLARIGSQAARLAFNIPMLYAPLYNPESIGRHYAQSQWYPKFRAIREQHDVLVFHQARHIWTSRPDPFSVKDNDKLLRGFASFVKSHPSTRAGLITLEYGLDVDDSKRLVAELGIERNVFWFPRMSRKELMVGLSLADVGSGEFHQSWLSCGTVYEALAMSKPLLHYREDELYRGKYPELYPLMNVRSAEAVAAALDAYVRDPGRHREMGEAGRRWFQRFAVDEPVSEYVRVIGEGVAA